MPVGGGTAAFDEARRRAAIKFLLLTSVSVTICTRAVKPEPEQIACVALTTPDLGCGSFLKLWHCTGSAKTTITRNRHYRTRDTAWDLAICRRDGAQLARPA